MTVALTDREVSILLGATLMHWGVPFRFTRKRALSAAEQSLLDETSDRLLSFRERVRAAPGAGVREFDLSDQEHNLLTEVVRACLGECGDAPVELQLQLTTRDRGEVENLVERLEQCHRGTIPA